MNAEQRARELLAEDVAWLIAYTRPHPIREFIVSRLVDRGWLTDEHAKPCELTESGRAAITHTLTRPAPTEAEVDGNVAAVRAKLLERSIVGLGKYGVTTERGDLSPVEWLRHLQEELLDGAVYVEAAISRIQTTGADVEAAARRIAKADDIGGDWIDLNPAAQRNYLRMARAALGVDNPTHD